MKKWSVKIVVLLIIGAIVNIAVAWGCAAWSEIHVTTVRTDQGFIRRAWQHNFGDDQQFGFDRIGRFNRRRGFGVRWDRLHATYRSTGAIAVRSYFQMGWPDYAVEGWYELTGLEERAMRWSHHPGVSIGKGDSRRPLVFAWRPIWPGFAINTIFYATILWLLTLGPFTARRMIRRKRGHCIKCGYDLRGTSGGVCPECGATTL